MVGVSKEGLLAREWAAARRKCCRQATGIGKQQRQRFKKIQGGIYERIVTANPGQTWSPIVSQRSTCGRRFAESETPSRRRALSPFTSSPSIRDAAVVGQLGQYFHEKAEMHLCEQDGRQSARLGESRRVSPRGGFDPQPTRLERGKASPAVKGDETQRRSSICQMPEPSLPSSIGSRQRSPAQRAVSSFCWVSAHQQFVGS